MHLAFIGDLVFVAPAWWMQVCSEWDAFAQSAASTLASSIWQGAVIVCGLEIALRLMPRISAAHRFAVWAAGFAVAAGLPLLPVVHWGASSGVAGGAVSGESARALLQLDARWGLAIAGLWVAASAIRGADLAVHSIRLRRLWKAARPVEVNEKLAATLENVRGGHVTICTTEILDRPSVIGFLAPRILIPAWLMGRLTPGELEQIVLHEAEHLRRARRLDKPGAEAGAGGVSAESGAGLDGTPAVPRTRDGVRRRRGEDYERAARVCGLPCEPGRARA